MAVIEMFLFCVDVDVCKEKFYGISMQYCICLYSNGWSERLPDEESKATVTKWSGLQEGYRRQIRK